MGWDDKAGSRLEMCQVSVVVTACVQKPHYSTAGACVRYTANQQIAIALPVGAPRLRALSARGRRLSRHFCPPFGRMRARVRPLLPVGTPYLHPAALCTLCTAADVVFSYTAASRRACDPEYPRATPITRIHLALEWTPPHNEAPIPQTWRHTTAAESRTGGQRHYLVSRTIYHKRKRKNTGGSAHGL